MTQLRFEIVIVHKILSDFHRCGSADECM